MLRYYATPLMLRLRRYIDIAITLRCYALRCHAAMPLQRYIAHMLRAAVAGER